jgi:Domain of unknown function (DUF4124)
MLRSSLLTLTLTASVLLAAPAGADVYKFKDDKGNVLYTDKPSTLPAERLNIQSQKTDVVAVQARQEADQQRQSSSDKTTTQNSQQRGDNAQAAEMTAKDKAERCTKARERYDVYMNSQKLYEQAPNGDRRYLSSDELVAAREQAKRSMDAMCK